jgi:NAD(P)-dependent dehydrogenase (short-subunit alcohol dehydrogenase family)
MKKQAIGGDIVNIVSKNAQLHMSRLMAAELGPYKIRVNVVNPDAVIEDSFIWQSGWAEPKPTELPWRNCQNSTRSVRC